ncbi:class I SAM-dependent methyltransferase [Candidatus Pelagibacter communis]|uniref:class I SAM-dependent methyltransferase n=1 Tax=Pelagibacter ubique TaxID=198252 RepID=UPI00094BF5B6|nr:class I SAM-dependent methyltransferase [Candidatus Pelagibacter ubique]
MKIKSIKNLKYSKSNIPKLAKYERIKKGLEKINLNKVYKILDLGCGAGQALYALKKLDYKGYYYGIDNDIEMINMSNKFYKRNNYKNFKFHKEEIQKFKTKHKFDLVLIWGVISFFDNYKQFIDKMDRCLNKNGTISLFSGFSESNYNVYVKYKIGDGKSQAGLNMHSLNEIESYFKKKGYKISKQKFIPSVNLIKSKNPLSSFVLYEQNRNKVIANGLNIIRKFYFIKAEKL